MGEFDEIVPAGPAESADADSVTEPAAAEVAVDAQGGAVAEIGQDEPTPLPVETPAAEAEASAEAAETPADLPEAPAETPAEVPADPAEAPAEAAADPIASIQEQLELDVPSTEEPAEESPADAPAEPDSSDATPEEALAEEGADEDDLAAAVAASAEQVGVEPTLDDIAPGTSHEVTAEGAEPVPVARQGAPWWPFLVYLGIWIAVAGVGIWQMMQVPAGQVLYESQVYRLFMYAGLVMIALGPVLILGVWLFSRMSPKRSRAGLLTSSMIKGAVFTLAGAVIWWGSLMAMDYLRLGRLL